MISITSLNYHDNQTKQVGQLFQFYNRKTKMKAIQLKVAVH